MTTKPAEPKPERLKPVSLYSMTLDQALKVALSTPLPGREPRHPAKKSEKDTKPN